MKDSEEKAASSGKVVPDTATTLVVAPGNRPGWATALVSLQDRNFRIFSIGMLVSFTALQMQMMAQNYLVYQLTGLAKAIGYVSTASGFSMLVFSFAGGIVADRVPKRNLLATTQIGIAVFALFIAILISAGLIQVWHIIVSAIAVGILGSFNGPARQSYVPDLVSGDRLLNALALNTGIMNMTRIAGPALAGVLIGIFGVAPTYYAKFFAYGIFVGCLMLIPVKGTPLKSASRSPLGAAAEGLSYLFHDKRVLDMLVVGMVAVVLGFPYTYFLPVFQEAVLHVGPTELGLMMSVNGAGAVVGAVVIASLTNYKYKGRILVISGLGFCAGLVIFALIASSGNFPLSLLLLALVGASGTAFFALNNALVLMITPPEMRGRVMGIFMTTFGMMPLGSLPMGFLVDSIGAPMAVAIFSGLGFVIIAIIAIFRPNIRRG